jgi:hypothetical protein
VKPGRPWLTSERRTVETVYPTRGLKATYLALKCTRSRGSIRQFARYHGIRGYRPPGFACGKYQSAGRLSKEDRADLQLLSRRQVRWPGMSHSQIAAALGVTKQAVSWHIARGRKLPPDEGDE